MLVTKIPVAFELETFDVGRIEGLPLSGMPTMLWWMHDLMQVSVAMPSNCFRNSFLHSVSLLASVCMRWTSVVLRNLCTHLKKISF